MSNLRSATNIQTNYRQSLDPFDIEVLLMHATGKSREFLLAHPEYILSETEYNQAIGYLERRAKHEPIAYITGRKEFYGLDFVVNQHTLIPRPETELMVEMTLDHISSRHQKAGDQREADENVLVIDIGTGSGNILISIAKHLDDCRPQTVEYALVGLDISPESLAVAMENARKHHVDDKIAFLQSDLLEQFFAHETQPESMTHPGSLLREHNYSHIILLANLPYLSRGIYTAAEADVKDYEPVTALVSEEEGLAHYRRLFEQIVTLRKENIFLHTTSLDIVLEISPEQHALIRRLAEIFFPAARVSLVQDYSQRYRFVKITL